MPQLPQALQRPYRPKATSAVHTLSAVRLIRTQWRSVIGGRRMLMPGPRSCPRCSGFQANVDNEGNFESLRDFPPVTLEDLLARRGTALEQKRRWPRAVSSRRRHGPTRKGREHSSICWPVGRRFKRASGKGAAASNRSIPFIERLEDYIDYLAEASVDEIVANNRSGGACTDG